MSAKRMAKADPDECREALAAIGEARSAEDLFAPINAPADYNLARGRFAELSHLMHPEAVPAHLRDEAALAYGKLAMLYAAHTQNATDAASHTHHIEIFASRHYTYTVRDGAAFGGSDLNTSLYLAERSGATETTSVVLHCSTLTAARSAEAIEHETKILEILTAKREAPAAAFYPRLLESAQLVGPNGTLTANALEGYLGTIDLANLRNHGYPDGLDLRAVAWIWRRLLFALGHAHAAGIIHGALTPSAVRILAAEHGLVLTDWTCSYGGNLVPPLRPERAAIWPLGSVSMAYPDLWAPEVLTGAVPEPGADIYMATRVMEWLMRPEDRIRPELRAFIAGCTLSAPALRPANAFALLDEFNAILTDIFGERTYTPLVLPAVAQPFVLSS